MKKEHDYIFQVVARLESAEIPYMLVGSHACAIHGEPRGTSDTDFVIDPTRSQLDVFLELFKEHEYVSVDAAHDALQQRGMFNAIDTLAGWKVDLICRKGDDFAKTEFERRATEEYLGSPIVAATAEDVILSKLMWAKKADSDRQVRDVAGVVRVSRERLDRDYLARWAKELDVESLLANVLREVDQGNG